VVTIVVGIQYTIQYLKLYAPSAVETGVTDTLTIHLLHTILYNTLRQYTILYPKLCDILYTIDYKIYCTIFCKYTVL